MLIIGDARFDSEGKIRFQLMREDIPISKRIRWMFLINSDKEYMTGLDYVLKKNISIRSHYDSDMGLGIGLRLIY